jgi:hypothetical protein
MNNTYPIQETNCGPLGNADYILIVVGSFNILETSCTVSYTLIDSANKKNIGQGWRTMEGIDFANWGQDNAYVKNWLFSQLGLSDPA